MNLFVAGNYVSQGEYKTFQPNPINRTWEVFDMEVLNLLSLADRGIGRLDTYSEHVNIDLFVRMHLAKEAVQSSKIEGTQTSMEEAFLPKEDISPEKKQDWEEVQNYILAMNESVKRLETLPFSSRLIKDAHNILLQGVRGKNKQPGEYRRSQNWIGGATIKDAVFIPPVHTTINDLIADMESFANAAYNMPDLLKVALIHYQFETIHPFLDGNGRVGRLLIPLYLVSKGILKRPILYISDFFERHRMLYYDNLMRVRQHNDLTQWFKFFLSGIIETADRGVKTFSEVLQLQKTINEKLKTMGSSSGNALKVINHMYSAPLITAHDVSRITKKTPATAYKIIAQLESLGIVKEISGAQRGKLYLFKEYFDIFRP